MISLWVFLALALNEVHASSVASPRIRIVDVAEKSSERMASTRLLPHRFELVHSDEYERSLRNNLGDDSFKSYVIYEQYPYKIYREWKGNGEPASYDGSHSEDSFYASKRPEIGIVVLPERLQNGHRAFPPRERNPTLAYQSVYSNVIRVFENSDGNEGKKANFFYPREKQPGWYEQEQISQILQPPFETFFPRVPFQDDDRYPVNFPGIFIPNERFPVPVFPGETSAVSHPLLPGESDRGLMVKSRRPGNKGGGDEESEDESESQVSPEADAKGKSRKRLVLCSFIRLNNRKFPKDGGPCARSEEDGLPLLPQEYPDNSDLPDDKLPVEHRRQNAQNKRIRRSATGENVDADEIIKREKRGSSFGYGFDSWGGSPGYGGGFSSFYNDFSRQGGRDGNGNSNSRSKNNRNQRDRNRNYDGSRSNYDYYGYQADNSNSRGLMAFLNSGGRRYKNRNNDNEEGESYDYKNSDDNENDNDEYNEENNNDYDSEENGENQNDRRRGSNSRRNNENSRNRRRNNNNNNNDNDYDDNRDNRRNNRNRQNNSRRNNNNNNNNSNSRNRNGYGNNNGYGGSNSYGGYGGSSNRGYGNSNGYGSNGGYGGYGSNSGYGGYGSSGGRNYGGSSYGNYGNNGYGSNGGYSNSNNYGSNGYGSNGGYSNSNNYGSNGGYGYGNDGYGGSGSGFGYFGQGSGF